MKEREKGKRRKIMKRDREEEEMPLHDVPLVFPSCEL
jgi:hypothetical protein